MLKTFSFFSLMTFLLHWNPLEASIYWLFVSFRDYRLGREIDLALDAQVFTLLWLEDPGFWLMIIFSFFASWGLQRLAESFGQSAHG